MISKFKGALAHFGRGSSVGKKLVGDPNWLVKDPLDISETVMAHRMDSIREIRKPMLLVSEIQRSGGTLLSQLFDGHPQIYAHPSELKIGHERPSKYHWPSLNLSAPAEEWFDKLKENKVLHSVQEGYSKSPKGKKDRLPFIFAQDVQKAVFLKMAAQISPKTQRDILDCYVTSYFNAWIDYQGIYRDAAQTKFWSGFAPRLTFEEKRCKAFFFDYPDGYLVSVIRNPLSWFASARRHNVLEYADAEVAIALWLESTQAALRNHRQHAGRVILLHFDDLIAKTETTMRRICSVTGMDFDRTLVSPTFNGMPLAPNTSFAGNAPSRGTIVQDTIRRAHDLPEKEAAYVEEKTRAPYQEALEIIARESQAAAQ